MSPYETEHDSERCGAADTLIVKYAPTTLCVLDAEPMESDLIAGLKIVKIIGTGLDVFEKELLAIDTLFWSLLKVVLHEPSGFGVYPCCLLNTQILRRRPEGALVQGHVG
jgi:hypothetical protein